MGVGFTGSVLNVKGGVGVCSTLLSDQRTGRRRTAQTEESERERERERGWRDSSLQRPQNCNWRDCLQHRGGGYKDTKWGNQSMVFRSSFGQCELTLWVKTQIKRTSKQVPLGNWRHSLCAQIYRRIQIWLSNSSLNQPCVCLWWVSEEYGTDTTVYSLFLLLFSFSFTGMLSLTILLMARAHAATAISLKRTLLVCPSPLLPSTVLLSFDNFLVRGIAH